MNWIEYKGSISLTERVFHQMDTYSVEGREPLDTTHLFSVVVPEIQN